MQRQLFRREKNMGQFKTEDEEQLEYIRKWYEMKEEKKREKILKKMVRNYEIRLAKIYIKYAICYIVKCIKLLLGKRV